MTWDQCDPDGPPAWWVARCHRAAARHPLCDEYGTPMDDDEADDDSDEADEADSDGSDDDEPAPEGDSGDGSAP